MTLGRSCAEKEVRLVGRLRMHPVHQQTHQIDFEKPAPGLAARERVFLRAEYDLPLPMIVAVEAG